jgi:hypothetical protein
LILALIVFVSMAVQDTAAAMKIRFLDGDKRRPWMAGYCEAVNDVGAALSIGIGGASVYRYGISAQTFEILAALAAAAILGTKTGDWLSQRKEKQAGELPAR